MTPDERARAIDTLLAERRALEDELRREWCATLIWQRMTEIDAALQTLRQEDQS